MKKWRVCAFPLPGEIEWVSIMISHWRMPDVLDFNEWMGDFEL
jgi:hypothetical protein